MTKDVSGTFMSDQNASAYCQSLVESGLTDWRMPTSTETTNAYTDGGATALKNASTQIWTATNYTTTFSYTYTMSTGAQLGFQATGLYAVRCVRDPLPSHLIVQT